LGKEDVVLVHPQNGFNGLILNCALVAASSLQLCTWYLRMDSMKQKTGQEKQDRLTSFGWKKKGEY
jgi:hypothetical protein